MALTFVNEEKSSRPPSSECVRKLRLVGSRSFTPDAWDKSIRFPARPPGDSAGRSALKVLPRLGLVYNPAVPRPAEIFPRAKAGGSPPLGSKVMTLRLSLRSLTLSILLLAPAAAAQAPQAARQSDEEKAKARKELERKALALLDETVQGAQALKLAENRAALRAQAADLLWTRDEKRARALFREAVSDIVAAQSNADAARERGWIFTNLRTQLLYTAAARDAQ